MKLTDTAIRAAKVRDKEYTMADGQGLSLRIRTHGKKEWLFRYTHPITSKRKQMLFGTYPEVSLSDARDLRFEARSLLQKGVCPLDQRDRDHRHAVEKAINTFDAVAKEWFDVWQEQKSAVTVQKCRYRIDKHLMPQFSGRPIAQITRRDILDVLRPLHKEGKLETLSRVKNIITRIMKYAIRTEYIYENPTTDLEGVFPTAKVKHASAILDPVEIGRYLNSAANYSGSDTLAIALQLAPLLFLRPGELRKLEWEWINFADAQIELPAEVMKMREPHIVPLPFQAQELIEYLFTMTGQYTLLFPGAHVKSNPITDATMTRAIRRMGYTSEQLTPHGWRATARTILEETLEYPAFLIEHQLAHKVKDANGRAYNRTQHLEKRRNMMQGYATFLCKHRKAQWAPKKSDNVIVGKFGSHKKEKKI